VIKPILLQGFMVSHVQYYNVIAQCYFVSWRTNILPYL